MHTIPFAGADAWPIGALIVPIAASGPGTISAGGASAGSCAAEPPRDPSRAAKRGAQPRSQTCYGGQGSPVADGVAARSRRQRYAAQTARDNVAPTRRRMRPGFPPCGRGTTFAGPFVQGGWRAPIRGGPVMEQEPLLHTSTSARGGLHRQSIRNATRRALVRGGNNRGPGNVSFRRGRAGGFEKAGMGLELEPHTPWLGTKTHIKYRPAALLGHRQTGRGVNHPKPGMLGALGLSAHPTGKTRTIRCNLGRSPRKPRFEQVLAVAWDFQADKPRV